MRDNPFLRRELHRRMRERNSFVVPCLYVATLTFLFGARYLDRSGYSTPWVLGRELFELTTKASTGLLAMLVPIFAAGSITLEREQKTWSSLILSRLRPRDLVAGKVSAAAAYVLLVAVTSVPVVLLCVLFGGVSGVDLLLHGLSVVVLVITLATLGVFVSAHFKRSVYAIAVCYGSAALAATVIRFLASFLRGLQYQLEIPILRPLTFLDPLFFLEDGAARFAPGFAITYLALAWLFAVFAVRRVRTAPAF